MAQGSRSHYLLYGLSLPRQLHVAPLQVASAFIHSHNTFESRACRKSSASGAHSPDVICLPSKSQKVKVLDKFIQERFTSQFSCNPSEPGKLSTEVQTGQAESETFLTLGLQSNLWTTLLLQESARVIFPICCINLTYQILIWSPSRAVRLSGYSWIVAKDLCISSARQSHKFQHFCPQTVAEDRNSEVRPNFYLKKKSLSLPHLQVTSSTDFHQLSSHYTIFSMHGKSVYSLDSRSLLALGPDLDSLLQDSTAFSPAGLLWAIASLKDSHNSPQKSACLHLIPSFFPLLSPRYVQLKRIVV